MTPLVFSRDISPGSEVLIPQADREYLNIWEGPPKGSGIFPAISESLEDAEKVLIYKVTTTVKSVKRLFEESAKESLQDGPFELAFSRKEDAIDFYNKLRRLKVPVSKNWID